ncbi:hypothetical protein BJX65DRAFT_311739 [Aspergillus insuetus]
MASTIYIGHLAHNTTAGTIDAQLSQQGLHSNTIIMTNRDDGTGRDFGFIRFPNEQEAQTAMDIFNQTKNVHKTIPFCIGRSTAARSSLTERMRNHNLGRAWEAVWVW